ncbi:MAG: nickel-dependent lactate racemase [Bryobacterales bacterium]|nr:nickel-dependent lactate racemase [Bryobacterales bacterium]
MRLDFAFGKTGLHLELPEGFEYRVLEAKSALPLGDQAGAVEEALDAPIGCAPLRDLARGKRTAAISVCDITRPAPNRLVLPPLLARLADAGIPRDGITILIATGLHRPATDAEIREIVGEEIASGYRVVNHDARALSEHRHLGTTAAGTPVYVDERFVAADLHITLGFIEPHLMLGFSGGRKLIAPGLAAQETIKVLHSPKFMRDPRAVEGSIEDNPLHKELLEISEMAGHDFLVDAALAAGPPGQRPVAGVFAGKPRLAHARGVEFVSRVMLETLDRPVDAVITTSAGYPLDLTFYQAIKGVTAARHIVKPGGKILLLAECSEGAGAPEFRNMLAANPDGAKFMDRIAAAPVVVDQWQLEKLALVTAKCDVLYYVPGLPAEYHASLWGTSYGTAADAVAVLAAGLKPGATIAVIPEGPYVLARAESRVREEAFA